MKGVELDSVETSAKVTENGQETTEQHKFYRYSKSTAEGTTEPMKQRLKTRTDHNAGGA